MHRVSQVVRGHGTVFLGYPGSVKPLAEAVWHYLEQESHLKVSSVDRELVPGDIWASRLESLVQSADYIVLLVPAEGTNSPWMQLEIAAAIAAESRSNEKRLIPVLLTPNASIPPFLAPYQMVIPKKPADPKSIAAAISEAIEKAPASADKAQEREAALRGMEAASDLIGRQEEVRRLGIGLRERIAGIALVIAFLSSALSISVFLIAEGTDYRDLASIVIAPLLVILGSITGFYFGSRSREQ
jgi:hypothetical protein